MENQLVLQTYTLKTSSKEQHLIDKEEYDAIIKAAKNKENFIILKNGTFLNTFYIKTMIPYEIDEQEIKRQQGWKQCYKCGNDLPPGKICGYCC